MGLLCVDERSGLRPLIPLELCPGECFLPSFPSPCVPLHSNHQLEGPATHQMPHGNGIHELTPDTTCPPHLWTQTEGKKSRVDLVPVLSPLTSHLITGSAFIHLTIITKYILCMTPCARAEATHFVPHRAYLAYKYLLTITYLEMLVGLKRRRPISSQ